MSILIVTVSDIHDHFEGESESADLLVFRDPDLGVWQRLAQDLNAAAVFSAELTSEFSIDACSRRWQPRGTVAIDPSDVMWTAVLRDAGWTTCDAEGPQIVLNPPRPPVPREVLREEFRRLIDTPEPVSTVVYPDDVSPEDDGLFGVFASQRLGGSSALLALSGAGRGSDPVALRNPAALHLNRVDDMPCSITVSPVTCSAVALSSNSQMSADTLEHFEDCESVLQLWDARGRSPADFWLIVELYAREVDPPVWLPAGQVFEQTTLTGRQTLATTADAATLVAPGRRTTLLLPAYCLDRHLRAPISDPMRATPFSAPLPRGSKQQRVWRERITARGQTP